MGRAFTWSGQKAGGLDAVGGVWRKMMPPMVCISGLINRGGISTDRVVRSRWRTSLVVAAGDSGGASRGVFGGRIGGLIVRSGLLLCGNGVFCAFWAGQVR